MDYRKAGVNINAGERLVEMIKPLAKATRRPEVIADIGGFSALFDGKFKKYKHPVLVSSTDGVGTKLKLAFLLNKHNTVGLDLVAMSVNDIITCGAEPLFFLDYFACGKLDPKIAAQVISGIAAGCKQANCTLIGGETAEMPGFYPAGEYDLAGFVVGVVDKSKIIDGSKIRPGDIVLGLPSSGPHSNGYSLIRKIFTDRELKKYQKELFAPTKIYVQEVLSAVRRLPSAIKGIAHITGGGFLDNIPRILPAHCQVVIQEGNWKIPPVFVVMQEKGKVPFKEMYRTFNMGIGLVLIVAEKDVPRVSALLKGSIIIGQVTKGNKDEVKIV
ncbi:MAG: phosphoribosylformylglycinamidine cyclo-ligase [bacterium]|nr:phosphoribosylformylglycinamidine cyclo-ligase [bacterium]MDD5353750.1 phosphoribosylformylglycinamidine cyclo-ligase [bacterium]MDD5755780.1 phosphoribosylformylglycinamidine cyclo-ligase [bacterium]